MQLPIPQPSSQLIQQPAIEGAINTHPMTTRFKYGIFKPKSYVEALLTLAEDLLNSKSTSVSQALQCVHWKKAMAEEYTALMQNLIWSLTSLQPNANAN